MKFGAKVGYDKVYCVTKIQPHIAYQSLYLSIFLSPTKNSVTDFSASSGAWVFKFCIHREDDQVYCVNENEGANVYCAFFFKISFFSSLTPL